mmetsp:Transcript_6314/g.13917  ORF Transcript_6314/g.13917 Transcript_6314/m.13917 type:complete len:717 (+) Transcript_6314:224-2374(+)
MATAAACIPQHAQSEQTGLKTSIRCSPKNLSISSDSITESVQMRMSSEGDESHAKRYTKHELIGQGAQKKVFKAFDEELGLEVAWNEVPVAELAWTCAKERDRIFSEIRVLKQLKHKNIISLYDWWFDSKTSSICFITELFTGTLRQYRRKHKNVDVVVLKRWAWQILQGLVYLHGHNPPIIHRDLKSDNIFVNGTSGEVKIGDLGFATMRAGLSMAMSVIGTPEFMAPELYEERYTEKVDVYSFGLCLLELATLEYPYAECRNAAQIFKKVTSGVPPAGLERVTDEEVKAFISTCICQDPTQRPESRQLLKHPFFDCIRQSGGGLHSSLKGSIGGLIASHIGHSSPHGSNSPVLSTGGPITLSETTSGPVLPTTISVSTSPAPVSLATSPNPPLSKSGSISAALGHTLQPLASQPSGVSALGTRRSVEVPTSASATSMITSVPVPVPVAVGSLQAASPFSSPALQDNQQLSAMLDQPHNHHTDGDLAESDVLFDADSAERSAAEGNSAPPVRQSADGRGSSVGSVGRAQQRWQGAEEDDEEEGGCDCAAGLSAELRQRLRLNCRKQDTHNMLSFSMSFVNHNGTRRKVGFLYDLHEDEPVQIANEMVENLSLNLDEAAFIASMIQTEVARFEESKAAAQPQQSCLSAQLQQQQAQQLQQQTSSAAPAAEPSGVPETRYCLHPDAQACKAANEQAQQLPQQEETPQEEEEEPGCFF